MLMPAEDGSGNMTFLQRERGEGQEMGKKKRVLKNGKPLSEWQPRLLKTSKQLLLLAGPWSPAYLKMGAASRLL